MNTSYPKARCRCAVGPANKLIADQLHADEFVVGHVVVERAYDPVAIVPRILSLKVAFKAIAFAETHHIQPVSPPSLAVMPRVQQVLNRLLIGGF